MAGVRRPSEKKGKKENQRRRASVGLTRKLLTLCTIGLDIEWDQRKGKKGEGRKKKAASRLNDTTLDGISVA